MLGLGLGLNKNNFRSNAIADLIKAGATFIFDPSQGKNTPFDTVVVDKSKNGNNVTLTGFAGTTASGYDNVTMPSGKVVKMANLDGVNDFGAMVASDSLNPIGTDDFAQLVVFKPSDTSARYWGLSRNLSITTDTQYGFYANVGAITYFISGAPIGVFAHGSDFVVVVFGRINGRRFLNVNNTEVHETAFANAISSQPNVQLSCRSNAADGLTKSAFSKGYQGLCVFFKGANGTLDKAKIIQLSQKIVKQIYGL